MTRAAIYARYSSDNQREESIDAQIRAIKEYCRKKDFEIVKIYTDEAASATTDERPSFLNMVKDSSLQLFDVLIVHKLDRFARNRYDSAFYKRQLKLNHVRVLSVLENLDDSPESIILESVLEGMAEYFSVNLARETMKGLKENALKGKHNGGTPPLGYDYIDEKYVVNNTEAVAVKHIFKRYSENVGYKTIIQELKAMGCKTKRGNDFTQTSIHDMLKNEKYTGTYVFNRQSERINGKRNQHKKKNDDQIIKVPNIFPRLIDDSVFMKINDRMKNRANGANSAKEIYLLSGKIFCGKCGAAMIGHTSHNKGYKYCSYVCGTRYRTKNCDKKAINRDTIEQLAMYDLEDAIFNEKAIKQLLNKLVALFNASKTEDKNDLKMFEKKLKEIDKNIDNIVKAVAKGLYSPAMNKAMENLENEKTSLNNMINDIKIKHSPIFDEHLIEQYLYRDYEMFKNGDPIDLKELVSKYVERITIYDDNFETEFKVVPSNGADNGDRTRTTGLGSRDSTVELYLHTNKLIIIYFNNYFNL
jgi:site-specific DNA recombinase